MSTDIDQPADEQAVSEHGDDHVGHDEVGHDVVGHGDEGNDDHDHAEHGSDEHGPSDRGYVVIAIILALMTAAEVGLSYMDLPGWFFLTALLTLMAVKFLTVVSFFMHLRFDNKIFSWLFYSGLLLAIFVYCVALATFQFFAHG